MKTYNFLMCLCIALVVISLGACKKKCHDCHYDGPNGEVELGEKCGDDVEALESEGYPAGDTTYTVHCHEH